MSTPTRTSTADPSVPDPREPPTRSSFELGTLPAAGLAAVGGLGVALSMPPWGFWPLSFLGVALLELAVGRSPSPRHRALCGLLFGAVWMYVAMAWMVQLTVPGYVVACFVYAGYHAVAELAAPNGPWRLVGRPAAHSLVEALRFAFPFGGVPLASMGIAQVGGPLAGTARIGGVILITWIVFQVGFLLGAGARVLLERTMPGRPADDGRPGDAGGDLAARLSVAAVAAVAVVIALAAIAPTGSATGETVRVAAVQGGGEQGTSALEVPAALVTARHLEATASIEADAGIDLVLWPENTIDVIDFAESDERDAVAAEAARLGVPISVGITEDTADRSRFVNAQVIVTPSGQVVDRYEKVRRVPFGEYVPLRGLLETLGAPVDRIGRDAVAGRGPAILDLPDGTRFAVVISWEVFFGGRVREGVQEGAEAVLNPTNGASYTGTIVQTQQVASSRLRALESGRWVVQAAPTGFSAVIDDRGDVLQRSSISERTILVADVELREGSTWYTDLGDAPMVVVLLAFFAVAAWAGRRPHERAARSELDHHGDGTVVDQLDAHLGAEPAGRDRRAELGE